MCNVHILITTCTPGVFSDAITYAGILNMMRLVSVTVICYRGNMDLLNDAIDWTLTCCTGIVRHLAAWWIEVYSYVSYSTLSTTEKRKNFFKCRRNLRRTVTSPKLCGWMMSRKTNPWSEFIQKINDLFSATSLRRTTDRNFLKYVYYLIWNWCSWICIFLLFAR